MKAPTQQQVPLGKMPMLIMLVIVLTENYVGDLKFQILIKCSR
jgi:hypothetical protein